MKGNSVIIQPLCYASAEVKCKLKVLTLLTRKTAVVCSTGCIKLYIRKDFFSEKGARYWNRLPRKVVEPPFLGVFKRKIDVALSDMV